MKLLKEELHEMAVNDPDLWLTLKKWVNDKDRSYIINSYIVSEPEKKQIDEAWKRLERAQKILRAHAGDEGGDATAIEALNIVLHGE